MTGQNFENVTQSRNMYPHESNVSNASHDIIYRHNAKALPTANSESTPDVVSRETDLLNSPDKHHRRKRYQRKSKDVCGEPLTMFPPHKPALGESMTPVFGENDPAVTPSNRWLSRTIWVSPSRRVVVIFQGSPLDSCNRKIVVIFQGDPLDSCNRQIVVISQGDPLGSYNRRVVVISQGSPLGSYNRPARVNLQFWQCQPRPGYRNTKRPVPPLLS